MPSAAKIEKPISTEGSLEPLKQGITIIEHKIRNLEKRKLRLEKYQEVQASGKELNSDQLQAVSKYDEVLQTLEFARDLSKQFHGIVAENAKQQKKQARKEALERTQQDVARVKEILIIQDVLANMGQDNIRDDFLAGNNKACKLSEEVLQQLDDLYTEVSPKREIEEGQPPFVQQLNKAAEHFICLTEGKNKEVVGTTYADLKKQITEISTCGYFDSSSEEPEAEPVPQESADDGQLTDAAADAVAIEPAPAALEDEYEAEEEESIPVQTTTFQPSKVQVEQPIEQQPVAVAAPPHIVPVTVPIIPAQQVNDAIPNVISTVGNSSFHFLQESELDKPEAGTPLAPPPSALPIPSQSFKKQTFAAASAAVPPPLAAQPPPPAAAAAYQQPPNQMSYGSAVAYAAPAPTAATAPPANTFAHPAQQQHVMVEETPVIAAQTTDVSDWNESVEVTNSKAMDNSDWNTQCDDWQQQSSNQQQSDNWNDNQQNDGFVTAGVRNSGRGGRGGRGPRGGDGGNRFESPARSGSGGGYYRNNNSDNSYYTSNGFQNRSGDNFNRRGSGPRGGGGGGNRSNNQDRSGGNYYRNNSEGGNNSYYQSNGYQSRGGEGGGSYNRRGGSGGGPRGGGNGPSSRPERGGPRGGGRGGGGSRGGGNRPQ